MKVKKGFLCLALLGACHATAFGVSMTANFNNPNHWRSLGFGIGPTMTASGGELHAHMPAHSRGDGVGGPIWGPGDFAAYYESTFALHDNFSVDFEYTLPSWPTGNGARMGIGIGPGNANVRTSEPFGEHYVFAAHGALVFLPTTDLSGRLRLSRNGNLLTGDIWNLNTQSWDTFGSGFVFGNDWVINLTIWSHAHLFQNTEVRGTFNNVHITADSFIFPRVVPEVWDFPAGICLLLIPVVYHLSSRKRFARHLE